MTPVWRESGPDEMGQEIEIEWSLERERFYAFRQSFHVDIQLHSSGDMYYVKDTKLLGYSVFWGNYHSIYSERSLAVDTFLTIPQTPLPLFERAHLLLKDQLGLRSFLFECKKGHTEIDPRRVLSICVLNYVWVLTGMRPLSVEAALEYLESASLEEMDNGRRILLGPIERGTIQELLQIDTPTLILEQPKHLKTTIKILESIDSHVNALRKPIS